MSSSASSKSAGRYASSSLTILFLLDTIRSVHLVVWYAVLLAVFLCVLCGNYRKFYLQFSLQTSRIRCGVSSGWSASVSACSSSNLWHHSAKLTHSSCVFGRARLCEGNGLESCLDESAEAGEAMSSIVDVAAGVL